MRRWQELIASVPCIGAAIRARLAAAIGTLEPPADSPPAPKLGNLWTGLEPMPRGMRRLVSGFWEPEP
jgi:hypothetical protein